MLVHLACQRRAACSVLLLQLVYRQKGSVIIHGPVYAHLLFRQANKVFGHLTKHVDQSANIRSKQQVKDQWCIRRRSFAETLRKRYSTVILTTIKKTKSQRRIWETWTVNNYIQRQTELIERTWLIYAVSRYSVPWTSPDQTHLMTFVSEMPNFVQVLKNMIKKEDHHRMSKNIAEKTEDDQNNRT